MIKSAFSEKFYEFFVNHEILRKYSFNIFIPSQNQESLLGFDALFHGKKVGFLMFQYKIVEKYERNPKYLSGDSFKFKLHKNLKSGYHQHNALVYWNTISSCQAYYVVPDYVDYSTFHKNCKLGTVFSNSRLIKPMRYIRDYKSHYVNFDSKNTFRHSVEKFKMEYIEEGNLENMLGSIVKKSSTEVIEEISSFIRTDDINQNMYTRLNNFLYDSDIVLLVFE